MSGATVYIKLDQNILTKKETVFLKEIAEISCSDKDTENKIKTIPFPCGGEGKPGRYVHSAVEIIAAVTERFPGVHVETMGASDFIMTLEKRQQPPAAWERIKTAVVCLLTFFGAAFCIMTFNNDVDITTLFGQLFEQFTGRASDGFTVLEISYSIGVGAGILIFFNHFSRKKTTSDPTPLQVEMRSYEDDINTALIETKERKGRV